MIYDVQQETDPESTSLFVVWRNPRTDVRASLRARQASNPHCQWSEQAKKIRSRRHNWELTHTWGD